MLDQNTVMKDLESNRYQHTAMKEKNKKRVLPESTSNPEDRTQLRKSHRSNKHFGNACCNI